MSSNRLYFLYNYAIIYIHGKVVGIMKCEYSDGFKVNYSGPLQITKGQDVNVFIKEARLPDGIKNDLDTALYKNSCSALRTVAETVTKTFGERACIH